jgi:hypothetical protein
MCFNCFQKHTSKAQPPPTPFKKAKDPGEMRQPTLLEKRWHQSPHGLQFHHIPCSSLTSLQALLWMTESTTQILEAQPRFPLMFCDLSFDILHISCPVIKFLDPSHFMCSESSALLQLPNKQTQTTKLTL